jgi:cyclomaltodextrinase / maltogenic alpha-amylase / neopullulanase
MKVHPEWSRNAVIYEVNIRQYTPEGTFRAFEQHLERLKSMGIDILWLMPVNPIGEKNRKGSMGSYYSIRDFLAVDPAYGAMEEFRQLVGKIHEAGMKVIIDWVANHTSWDNSLIIEHPEWYIHDPEGNIISPVPDWTDVAGLDYNNPGLREYMKNALLWWVRETGIDGFRCDVAGMVPVSFWNMAVPEIRNVKPLFMLAEWDTPEMHDTAFDMTYAWDLYKTMNGIASGNLSPDHLDLVLEKESTEFSPDAYRMRFISNHDENSWNGTEFERLGEAVRVFTILMFTLPGMPLIYSGQEAGSNKRLKFFDKDTIHWEDLPLMDFYAKLIRLKKENMSLHNGTSGGKKIKIRLNGPKEIYAFIRRKENNEVFVIANLSSNKAEAVLEEKMISGDFREYFTADEKRLDAGMKFSLDPWDFKIWVKPF